MAGLLPKTGVPAGAPTGYTRCLGLGRGEVDDGPEVLSRRPLRFLWIADCSGSMNANGKIQSLNNAAREALPSMRRVARENSNAQVLARVLVFADGARSGTGTDADRAVRLAGTERRRLTDLGTALELLAARASAAKSPAPRSSTVLVVLSDGYPTDDFDAG